MGEWHEPFLYQWWKEGLISAKNEPAVPVQVFGPTNSYSFITTRSIDIYFTELLHYLPNIHNPEGKVTAYIQDPTGKQYPIKGFVYDPDFFSALILIMIKGGWVGSFLLPDDAVNGSWTIKRVEVQNGDEIKTFSNGVDFFNAITEITDGLEIT